MEHGTTRQHLLETGMALLLERGYAALGVQAVLERTGVPKGSFYHYFASKQDFALQAVEMYMQAVHEGLDVCLEDRSQPPLERVRGFFELSEAKYREEGYLGCLLGGLGQELSGTSDVFRDRIQACLAEIAERIAEQLEEARERGDIAPDRDARATADMIIDCWEGAALRSRLLRDPAPLRAMLDFCLAAPAGPARAAAAAGSTWPMREGDLDS